MKKASEVLIIIGFVLAILGAIGCLIGMIVLFGFSSPEAREVIIQGIKDGTIHTTMSGTPEQIADFVIGIFKGCAIGCLFAMLLQIATAVVSMIAMKKNNVTGLYIASLVLAALGGVPVTVVGSIFGIVYSNQQNKQPQEAQ